MKGMHPDPVGRPSRVVRRASQRSTLMRRAQPTIAGPHEGSGFSEVDHATDPTKYVRRVDAINGTSFWQAIKRRARDLLDVRHGARILDLGCGTGDEALELARLVGSAGRVVGVDRSQTMVAEARRRAAGKYLPVEYRLSDAQCLDFPDEWFDGCRCERVLQHLDDPRQAVAELVRVVRPDGRVVVV